MNPWLKIALILGLLTLASALSVALLLRLRRGKQETAPVEEEPEADVGEDEAPEEAEAELTKAEDDASAEDEEEESPASEPVPD